VTSGKLIASFDHQDEVNGAVFSPDGARILTGSSDKTAKLWDAVSGKLTGSFDHQDAVIHVAFSSDGTRILTASADKTAKLWDTISGKLINSFAHQDAVRWAAFSPNGARVVTASADRSAKLWDTTTGELMASFAHRAGVYCAAFSPDGARILTASADNSAKLWDVASGKLIASFDHQGTVWWVGLSPDGARVLTASWDKTAKLWDVATAEELARQMKESIHHLARTGSSVSTVRSSAQQVDSLSEAASGLEYLDDGSLVAVDEERRLKLTKQLKDLAQDPGPDARLIRWFFSTGGDRTVFPASDVKVAAWVDGTLLTNPNVTEEWLRNGLVFLPDHPLIHIALAGFETNSTRADFLRSFGLARLPKNSLVCTRAGEMLLVQHRPELALVAVDKALTANPADLPAQRLRLRIQDAMVP
jgi:predicted oxidoreductase (fatty acid repression mutant protein)